MSSDTKNSFGMLQELQSKFRSQKQKTLPNSASKNKSPHCETISRVVLLGLLLMIPNQRLHPELPRQATTRLGQQVHEGSSYARDDCHARLRLIDLLFSSMNFLGTRSFLNSVRICWLKVQPPQWVQINSEGAFLFLYTLRFQKIS